ncbi:hypothetical protein T4B_8426 [Trichinella pseudospiralis]|uniref:Uncharacterized protein n=1 Tax=Trichinella pseudospiralis TaxID=6337 RepID=A0A0V1IRJ6_TRIPS|nr:hypothetical protein T4B_8426 [Trichinella pseudospiralis]KRZ34010.1 hypothetical protein T4C_6234 [Trichinella pseudospiralis]
MQKLLPWLLCCCKAAEGQRGFMSLKLINVKKDFLQPIITTTFQLDNAYHHNSTPHKTYEFIHFDSVGLHSILRFSKFKLLTAYLKRKMRFHHTHLSLSFDLSAMNLYSAYMALHCWNVYTVRNVGIGCLEEPKGLGITVLQCINNNASQAFGA